MARLLVAEHEVFFSDSLMRILSEAGHFVVIVVDAKSALDQVTREDFDGVIVDEKLPGLSNCNLVRYLTEIKPTPFLKVVAFSDHSQIPSPGVDASQSPILIKPFEPEAVNQVLKSHLPDLKSSPSDQLVRPAQKPVPLGWLKVVGVAEFEISKYVAGRPQPVVRAGQSYSLQDLGLSSKTQLYGRAEDLSKLVANAFSATQASAANAKLTPDRRAAVMQDCLQLMSEKVVATGLDAATTEMAVETFQVYLNSLEDDRVWEMISNLDTYSRPIFAQTLGVTAVCLILANELKLTISDQFKLLTAALFHDVGHLALNPVLMTTPRILLSMKDRALLEKHVELGVALLQKSGWASSEICSIILQHHEDQSGTGFPRALRGPQIHPLAKIIHVADDFCLSVMKSAGHPGLPPMRAVEGLRDKKGLDQKYVMTIHHLLVASQTKVKA